MELTVSLTGVMRIWMQWLLWKPLGGAPVVSMANLVIPIRICGRTHSETYQALEICSRRTSHSTTPRPFMTTPTMHGTPLKFELEERAMVLDLSLGVFCIIRHISKSSYCSHATILFSPGSE